MVLTIGFANSIYGVHQASQMLFVGLTRLRKTLFEGAAIPPQLVNARYKDTAKAICGGHQASQTLFPGVLLMSRVVPYGFRVLTKVVKCNNFIYLFLILTFQIGVMPTRRHPFGEITPFVACVSSLAHFHQLNCCVRRWTVQILRAFPAVGMTRNFELEFEF